MDDFHGILIEETKSDPPGSPFDLAAPIITSPVSSTALEETEWTMTLVTDQVVSFAKREGADSHLFTLDGTELSLPALDFGGGVTALICDLSATGASGRVTDFSAMVLVGEIDAAPPVLSSPRAGCQDLGHSYAVTLIAAPTATFQKRSGADTHAFSLAGSTLLLPLPKVTTRPSFACNLCAIDGAGRRTNFVHTVLVSDAPPLPPGFAYRASPLTGRILTSPVTGLNLYGEAS
jgi:hypothetical protein